MPGKHYSPEERALIETLASEGLGATAIAGKLQDRTPGGVQGQLAKLGFVDPQRSSTAKARRMREMTAHQHRRFCDFLRENIVHAPPIELMRHWNEYAVRHRFPTVSIDTVDYWVDKMGIRLSAEEARVNVAYQQIRRQRYAKRSETARTTIQEKAEQRKQQLRERGKEVLRKQPRLARRVCPECGETWPLTPEFFRAKRNEDNGKWYFETKGCIPCANKIRRQVSRLRANGHSREEIRQLLRADQRRRRNARADEILQAARQRRAALTREEKRLPQQPCADCQEVWPLTAEFWKPAANGAFPQFCRFCDCRYRREQRRARADGRSVASLRERRRILLEQASARQRAERRAELQRQLERQFRKNGEVRVCPLCDMAWPLTGDFWLYESPMGPRAGKLARRYCRCCSHDKDAQRNRHRKRRRRKIA